MKFEGGRRTDERNRKGGMGLVVGNSMNEGVDGYKGGERGGKKQKGSNDWFNVHGGYKYIIHTSGFFSSILGWVDYFCKLWEREREGEEKTVPHRGQLYEKLLIGKVKKMCMGERYVVCVGSGGILSENVI